MVYAIGDAHSCRIGDYLPPDYAQGVMDKVAKDDTLDNELQVFTQEDLEIVITLLKRTCCQEWLLKVDSCEWQDSWPNYQPQSPYAADHLMFVGMTKLDGETERCEALRLESCGMASAKLDAEPVEWREKIREIAKSTDGYSSQSIYELFKLYRWGAAAFTADDWNMPKAYARLCKEVTSIIQYFPDSNDALDVNEQCNRMVSYRYDQEYAYVQTLIVEKWVQYVWNMMREYLTEYFADQRLSGLVLKYGVLDACWRMVVRTTERTKCCNE